MVDGELESACFSDSEVGHLYFKLLLMCSFYRWSAKFSESEISYDLLFHDLFDVHPYHTSFSLNSMIIQQWLEQLFFIITILSILFGTSLNNQLTYRYRVWVLFLSKVGLPQIKSSRWNNVEIVFIYVLSVSAQ